MRRVLLGILGVVLVLIVALVTLCVLNPLMGMIIVAEITGSGYGHPQNPPALARGEDLRAGMSDRHEKSRRWTKILEQQFPTGTAVQRLLQTARDQGFEISQSHRSASYAWGGMPCLYTLYVHWTEDANHRLVSIKGDSYSGCL
jgi:hypothetical protein